MLNVVVNVAEISEDLIEKGEMLMRILPSIIEMIYGGSCPMCHFLFSFPRARAVLRQVSECIPVMVTMEL